MYVRLGEYPHFIRGSPFRRQIVQPPDEVAFDIVQPVPRLMNMILEALVIIFAEAFFGFVQFRCRRTRPFSQGEDEFFTFG